MIARLRKILAPVEKDEPSSHEIESALVTLDSELDATVASLDQLIGSRADVLLADSEADARKFDTRIQDGERSVDRLRAARNRLLERLTEARAREVQQGLEALALRCETDGARYQELLKEADELQSRLVPVIIELREIDERLATARRDLAGSGLVGRVPAPNDERRPRQVRLWERTVLLPVAKGSASYHPSNANDVLWVPGPSVFEPAGDGRPAGVYDEKGRRIDTLPKDRQGRHVLSLLPGA